MSRESLKIGITCYPTFGGSGVIATEIGMAMARRGHQVHFISYDIPRRLNRFTDNIYFHEVEVKEYPLFQYPPYSLGLASKIVDVATYEGLDLLHAHYAVPHATSAYLAAQVLADKAPKIITTLHGTDITLVGNERSYLPITRFSIMKSDGVTAPSQYLRQATYDKLNIPSSSPISVIPNFVDTTHYSPTTERDFTALSKIFGRCSAEEKIIVHVSNFRPVKRVPDVIRVFEKVNREENAHLVLIGDGPERSSVENLVRELELCDKVCFLGKQESFVNILQHADVFLLPSESESFGLAALEAMSCGVPVVASNTDGIPEVIADKETGFLSEVGDIESMSKNVLHILQQEENRKTLSKAARKRVEEEFELELVTKKIRRLLLSDIRKLISLPLTLSGNKIFFKKLTYSKNKLVQNVALHQEKGV